MIYNLKKLGFTMTPNIYKSLGIPDHKFHLLLYEDIYTLESSFHNFHIIFTHDTKLRFLTSEYLNGWLLKKKYIKDVRKHFDYYYGLKFGNRLHKYIRKTIYTKERCDKDDY